jgi:diphosphomevalonate decarboxylase
LRSSARAHANIALVKYWGKSDVELNIPAVGSISITLRGLWSDTSVEFDPVLRHDSFELDGRQDALQLARVSACLDLLRVRAGADAKARVESRNNFPTGAGLASSASGFAALVCAAADALGLALSPIELSRYARRGSGSAARSIYGGFVEMRTGAGSPDVDAGSFATQLLGPSDWPLTVVIAVTAKEPKSVGSSTGMGISAATSPFYGPWVQSSTADLDAARTAIATRDFEQLAEISEHSCLKLHALAMSSRPPLIYWKPATLGCIDAMRALARDGIPVFFTIDAGPQLKAICLPSAVKTVVDTLHAQPGVIDVIVSELGPDAAVTAAP